MRIKYKYSTGGGDPKRITEIKNILNGYFLVYSYKENLNSVIPALRHRLEFTLYEDMDIFDKIRTELEPFNVPAYVSAEYDKTDMENAEWYEIHTGKYQCQLPDDDDFDYLKRTFDLTNYCPLCGIGKVQNNPFRLKHEPKEKNIQFWGLLEEDDAIFVREETKNILLKENLKGIHFLQPVLYKDDKPIKRFYQLIIENVLDEGLDESNVEQDICKFYLTEDYRKNIRKKYCGRIKYCIPKGDGCIFEKKLFAPNIDFYLTNEYFGAGDFAGKINIISKKVYEIIKKNKLEGLVNITPIRFKK